MSRKRGRLLKTPKDHYFREQNYNGVSGRSLRDWQVEKVHYRWGAGLCETGKMDRYTTDKGDIVIQKSTLSDTL